MTEETLLGLLVIVMGIGGIAGIAYSLETHRRRRGSFGPKLPPAGRLGHTLWWAARLLAALMVLGLTAAALFRLPALAQFAVACFVLFFVDHALYALVRLTGK